MKKKRDANVIHLSPEDQEAFAKAILDPPPLAPALKRAMRRRNALLSDKAPDDVWEPNDFKCHKHGVYGSELPWPTICIFCAYEKRIAGLEALLNLLAPGWAEKIPATQVPESPARLEASERTNTEGLEGTRNATVPPQSARGADLILSTFRKVAEHLHLTLDEQAGILGVPRTVMETWQTAPEDQDKLDRMAFFTAIYFYAETAFPVGGAEGWLRRPNMEPRFNGLPPLELIIKGRFEGLLRTHDYIRGVHMVW